MRNFLSLTTAFTIYATSLLAEAASPIVSSSLSTGWVQHDGQYVSAFELKLAPKWKTYWRVPGDAGIPPELNFSGSKNVKDVQIIWPRPVPFGPDDMRSLGYIDGMVLPLYITPQDPDAPVIVSLNARLGICEDICIPADLTLQQNLDTTRTRPIPKIVAALLDIVPDRTDSTSAKCRIHPNDTGWSIEAALRLPNLGAKETMVIEHTSRDKRVDVQDTHREGKDLLVTAQLRDTSGTSLARNQLTFTLIGERKAVSITGCQR